MTSHTFSRNKKTLATLTLTIVVIMTFALFTITDVQAQTAQTTKTTRAAQAAHGKGFAGKPHVIRFSHRFPSSQLAGAQLPHWSSSFTYQGKTYPYSMVGTDPSKGSATTTVPVVIIPLKMTFLGLFSFDGTQKVSNTTNSPIFKSATFISGNTQYGDAIQRAEFWNSVSAQSPNYHVLLGTPTVAPTVTINVPTSSGTIEFDTSGKLFGAADVNWFDTQIQSLLTSLHFAPNVLPIFLSNDVYLYQGNALQCCIGGYHNAVQNSAGLQTYIWTTNADAGLQGGFGEDVSAFSHELAEWINDPFTNNTVPNWSVPSQPQYGCSNVLETGDPLVNVLFTVNGYSSSHLQDEALFSWFARQSPSIAIHGLYSYLGTFKTYSPAC